MPVHLGDGKRDVLVVFNGSTDPADPVVHLPPGSPPFGRATLLAPLAKPAAVSLRRQGRTQRVSAPIPYLGYLVVES
jgi:hypothetical protein